MHFPSHVQGAILGQLGRALTIRHVDAGVCHGCEPEIRALSNLRHRLEGLGMKFVAPSAVLHALVRK